MNNSAAEFAADVLRAPAMRVHVQRFVEEVHRNLVVVEGNDKTLLAKSFCDALRLEVARQLAALLENQEVTPLPSVPLPSVPVTSTSYTLPTPYIPPVTSRNLAYNAIHSIQNRTLTEPAVRKLTQTQQREYLRGQVMQQERERQLRNEKLYKQQMQHQQAMMNNMARKRRRSVAPPPAVALVTSLAIPSHNASSALIVEPDVITINDDTPIKKEDVYLLAFKMVETLKVDIIVITKEASATIAKMIKTSVQSDGLKSFSDLVNRAALGLMMCIETKFAELKKSFLAAHSDYGQIAEKVVDKQNKKLSEYQIQAVSCLESDLVRSGLDVSGANKVKTEILKVVRFHIEQVKSRYPPQATPLETPQQQQQHQQQQQPQQQPQHEQQQEQPPPPLQQLPVASALRAEQPLHTTHHIESATAHPITSNNNATTATTSSPTSPTSTTTIPSSSITTTQDSKTGGTILPCGVILQSSSPITTTPSIAASVFDIHPVAHSTSVELALERERERERERETERQTERERDVAVSNQHQPSLTNVNTSDATTVTEATIDSNSNTTNSSNTSPNESANANSSQPGPSKDQVGDESNSTNNNNDNNDSNISNTSNSNNSNNNSNSNSNNSNSNNNNNSNNNQDAMDEEDVQQFKKIKKEVDSVNPIAQLPQDSEFGNQSS